MKRAPILVLSALVAMCAPLQKIVAPQTPVAESQTIEITYCGQKPEKPPLKKLFFNITLRNQSDHQRWFLLPDALYSKPRAPRNGGIDAVEVYAPMPPPRVSVARFTGTLRLQPESAGGFQALLLPAGATITIRRLTIELWGEIAEVNNRLPIRLVIADHITIAGSPAMLWIGPDLLTDTKADVERDQFKAVHSRFTPDMKEIPVGIEGTQELTIANALATRCSSTSR